MEAKDIIKHHDADPNTNPWVHGKPPLELIEVVPYDQNWPPLFVKAASEINAALEDRALHLEHIGSTSVPGLAAKPVIDIDLMVADAAAESNYVPELESIGYELFIREPDWHEHRCFRHPNPRVNLHVFSPECPELVRHVMFRDWLRNNVDDRILYEKVKLASAGEICVIMDYNKRKEPVIREIYDRVFRAANLI